MFTILGHGFNASFPQIAVHCHWRSAGLPTKMVIGLMHCKTALRAIINLGCAFCELDGEFRTRPVNAFNNYSGLNDPRVNE